jgi:type I restriction enzyme S subunit
MIPKDSILLCCTASVGVTAINKIELTTNQQFNALTVKDERITNPNFIYYWCLFSEEVFKSLGRATTIDYISMSKIRDMEVVLPSRSEQKAIVEKLDAAFAEIDKLENLRLSQISLIGNLNSSYFDELLNREGDQSVTLWPLGELAAKVVVAFVGITSPFYRESGIPFLRTQNVSRNGMRLDKLKYVTAEFHEKNAKSQLAAGDVLLSRVITDQVTVGIVPAEIVPANCANVIIVRPGERLLPEYLAAYISSPIAQKYLLSRKVGSAQVVVNTGIVKDWPIPVLSMHNQVEVTNRILQVNDLITRFSDALSTKARLLDELRSALLSDAFAEISDAA